MEQFHAQFWYAWYSYDSSYEFQQHQPIFIDPTHNVTAKLVGELSPESTRLETLIVCSLDAKTYRVTCGRQAKALARQSVLYFLRTYT